jgi:hypothetical protein
MQHFVARRITKVHIKGVMFRAAFCCAALLILSVGVLKADATAYANLDGGDFGTIDLSTGAFTLLGNSGVTLSGMAVYNGVLYGDSLGGTGTLYTINPANGSLTTVGSSGKSYVDFGDTTSGLFAEGESDGNLYSINSATGAATLVGATHPPYAGGYSSISLNSSTLYYTQGTGSDFYTLNTSTGAATLVGSLGDSLEMGAMIFEDGILYAAEDSPVSNIDTINPATGSATIGPAVTGAPSVIFGLAPNPVPPPSAVPEPSSIVLLATLLGLTGAAKRKFLLETVERR